MSFKKNIFYCVLFLSVSFCAKSQNYNEINIDDSLHYLTNSTNKIQIKNIEIVGNKKTRAYIILRELPFKNNDSIFIQNIQENLEQARRQVYNLTLFSEVKFKLQTLSSSQANLIIILKERWYILPVPELKLIDKNFDAWYYNYNHDLKRISYGLKVVSNNFTGRNDQFSIALSEGLNRNISFNYNLPFINKSLTKGFSFGVGYNEKKVLPYKTDFNDKLLYYSSDSLFNYVVGKTVSIQASYTIRKGFFAKHIFAIGYSIISITDSILLQKNNSNYFNSNKPFQNILDFTYTYQYVNVNNVSYPTIGKSFFATALKRGLSFSGGINALTFTTTYNKYIDLHKNWFANFGLYAIVRLPFYQAFINQTAFSGTAENYLRGLDLKEINGVASALFRSTLKNKMAQFKMHLPFKIKEDTYLPFSIYPKTYFDVGYAYNKPQFVTNLNNKLLYSGGIGVDIVSIYDINFRLEYSCFNQINKNHLFLHTLWGF